MRRGNVDAINTSPHLRPMPKHPPTAARSNNNTNTSLRVFIKHCPPTHPSPIPLCRLFDAYLCSPPQRAAMRMRDADMRF